MPLSDIAIRAAKPGPKPIKLSDERGLFLLVQPSGGKLWRLKYRIAGKEKKLSLGRYPDVGLKEAREVHSCGAEHDGTRLWRCIGIAGKQPYAVNLPRYDSRCRVR